MFKINGLQTPLRRDSDSYGGGGLLVYVKNDINARRREDLETQTISWIWFEILPPVSKPFLVGSMYGPPDSRVEYMTFTTSLSLTQLVNEHTRAKNASQTIIDHIYTNAEENIQQVHVEGLCLSDHYAVFCYRKSQSNISKNIYQSITVLIDLLRFLKKTD